MARIYKRVERHFIDDVLDSIACDLCGSKAKGEDWASGIYEVNDVTIEVVVHQREGQQYPDGGSGTEYVVDMCPSCFKNRLIPWLRSEGATIKEMEWDW